MSKLFAVLVQTVEEYYEYSKAHPEHQQRQRAWFERMQEAGKLVCCGPFVPPDRTGLWVLRANSLEDAQEIVKDSPRHQDGMLADTARVVEWQVMFGKERLG